jgi:hypothetical protein
MRIGWWLFGAAALVSCGGPPKTNLVFQIEPPPMGNPACVGVAGFEVSVTAGGRSSDSGPVPNRGGPVLASASCHPQAFTMQDIDLESPASVVVIGHDGANAPRVQTSGSVENLHASTLHLQLKATPDPPLPILLVDRTLLLAGQPVSDITHLFLETKAKAPLVDIGPGDYFLVEPAAYGVPSTSLAPDGASDQTSISVDVTTKSQGALPRQHLTAFWNMAGYYDLR